MNKAPFTKEFLLQLFDYSPELGILIWKNHWCKNKLYLIGTEAGSIYEDNKIYYKKIKFNNTNYVLHKLIYFLETGIYPTLIDHIDGNGLNNRFSNLREVTFRKNSQNKKIHRYGKLLGASFHKRDQCWRSQIWIDNRKKHLGCFNSELEAHQRYIKELKIRGLL